MKNIICRAISVVLCMGMVQSAAVPLGAQSSRDLVASYVFSNARQPFTDTTGHGHDALAHGKVRTSSTNGAVFDGHGVLYVPLSKALLGPEATISVRVRGRAAALRQITQERAGRGPEFQICGSTLEYANNTDVPRQETPLTGRLPDAKARARFTMELHTGTIDLIRGTRTDIVRVGSPRDALEPMLQFVNGSVYYEYFATTGKAGPWEIYTGKARADQSGWSTIQRTHEKEGYRVEFGNLQVVGNHIYYGYPERDAKHDAYQTWTARSNIDGSHWRAWKRTSTGGWFPVFQVAGSKVYVIFTYGPSATSLHLASTLAIASMNTDGSDWKILRTIGHDDIGRPFVLMQIDKGIIYISYTQRAKAGGPTYLRTARMNVDGTGFHSMQRTFGIENGQPANLQIVGHRIYYVYWQTPSPVWPSSRKTRPWEYWFASSNLDGSDWHAHRIFADRTDLGPFYKGIQVVGGRTYLGAEREGKNGYSSSFVAAEGSNLINRGGLYGIGITNDSTVRAFVDSGQEYLCRGEAPHSTSGTVAEARFDPSAWHTYTAVFSRGMVRLYIDGVLENVQRGDTIREGNANYPLEIGDGFVGSIKWVNVYRRALSPEEIAHNRT